MFINQSLVISSQTVNVLILHNYKDFIRIKQGR